VAFGQQAVYGNLAKFRDADNAWGLIGVRQWREFENPSQSNHHQWVRSLYPCLCYKGSSNDQLDIEPR
jgi:hypothetical protein